MPPPEAPVSCVPTFAPDKETRAAAETLEALQGHQRVTGLPGNSSLSTPPGEAEYFKGGGLMETSSILQENLKDLLCTGFPTISARHTGEFDYHHLSWNHSFSQSGSRRLDKSHLERRFAKHTADGFG